MILNTKINFQILIIIFILSAYHFLLHNGLEKTFSQTYFNFDNIRRPSNLCDKEINCTRLYCTGMPSGHAEGFSVLCFLLYFYKIIPLWLCLIIIMIISLQRIISNVHTFNQVLIGSILGFTYANIYKYFNLSIKGFLTIFSIGLMLTLLSVYKIDKEVRGPVPEWVDKDMMASIKKKQESPLYIKLGSLYANAIIQNRTFISWAQLEDYLDIIVERIRHSGKQYDAVVGIKTGGAIVSDYISLKLGIPNYKIKLSREEYNCDKQPNNTVGDMIKKNLYYKQGEFTICEGINNSLNGKNVILIDEIVATGKTMEEAYNYLKERKRVNDIYPTCVSFYKPQYKGQLNINYVLNGTILVWPWGYDN